MRGIQPLMGLLTKMVDVVVAPFTVISPLTPRRCTFSTTSRSMADVLSTDAFAFCLLSGQCLCRKNEAEPLADRQPGHLSWLSFFLSLYFAFASPHQHRSFKQGRTEPRTALDNMLLTLKRASPPAVEGQEVDMPSFSFSAFLVCADQGAITLCCSAVI